MFPATLIVKFQLIQRSGSTESFSNYILSVELEIPDIYSRMTTGSLLVVQHSIIKACQLERQTPVKDGTDDETMPSF